MARFEASMHRWVAMSEGDYSIGLINDSKYGYDARGQRIRMTLIKSGTYPFETADRETHRCRYGLTFANGPDAIATIARRAESFSHPMVPTIWVLQRPMPKRRLIWCILGYPILRSMPSRQAKLPTRSSSDLLKKAIVVRRQNCPSAFRSRASA